MTNDLATTRCCRLKPAFRSEASGPSTTSLPGNGNSTALFLKGHQNPLKIDSGKINRVFAPAARIRKDPLKRGHGPHATRAEHPILKTALLPPFEKCAPVLYKPVRNRSVCRMVLRVRAFHLKPSQLTFEHPCLVSRQLEPSPEH